MSNALKAAFEKDADETKWRVSIIGSELMGALKQLSTQSRVKLQAATLLIRAVLKRSDSEALRNVVPCRTVFHNLVAEVRRCVPDTTNSVVGF